MEKVRINLKRGVRSWSFHVYDSVEAAYFLKDEMHREEDEEFRKVVTLKPGEFIEAEWVGTEWVYSTEQFRPVTVTDPPRGNEKYDRVHVGKLTPLKDGPKNMGHLEFYSGWVVAGQIPWHEDANRDKIRVTILGEKVHAKIDFDEVIPALEEEIESLESDEVKVLN